MNIRLQMPRGTGMGRAMLVALPLVLLFAFGVLGTFVFGMLALNGEFLLYEHFPVVAAIEAVLCAIGVFYSVVGVAVLIASVKEANRPNPAQAELEAVNEEWAEWVEHRDTAPHLNCRCRLCQALFRVRELEARVVSDCKGKV